MNARVIAKEPSLKFVSISDPDHRIGRERSGCLKRFIVAVDCGSGSHLKTRLGLREIDAIFKQPVIMTHLGGEDKGELG
jgi:hypothetical protein